MKRDGSLWVLDRSDRRGLAAVTAIVTGLVTNNELNFVADSTTLGGDPAFGVVKALQISFQFGGINQVRTFPENGTVRLCGTGEPLTVSRALYADPRLLRDPVAISLVSSNATQLRRIELPKNVVAFCGGRMTGAALTAEGEVWTWGEAMGQHTPAILPLQLVSRLFGRLGAQVHWGEPGPVILKEPARLKKVDL